MNRRFDLLIDKESKFRDDTDKRPIVNGWRRRKSTHSRACFHDVRSILKG